MVGLVRIELTTSPLSGVRSSRLSYRPACKFKYPQLKERTEQGILRKEVIQPHLPVLLPCYDLAPITGFTVGASPLAVEIATSGAPSFRGLTGGVYKA
jgi:hypothetical protein